MSSSSEPTPQESVLTERNHLDEEKGNLDRGPPNTDPGDDGFIDAPASPRKIHGFAVSPSLLQVGKSVDTCPNLVGPGGLCYPLLHVYLLS